MQQRRNTLQRELVLNTVRALHTHPTAEDIYLHIAVSHPLVSRATVYRNLNLLSAQNAILRVSHLNAADRFDFKTTPHYHFRCKACDSVFDISLPYNHNLLQEVNNPQGFLLEECEITFAGLCPQCRKKNEQEHALSI